MSDACSLLPIFVDLSTDKIVTWGSRLVVAIQGIVSDRFSLTEEGRGIQVGTGLLIL